MTGTKCTRELASGNVTWGEAVNLALACLRHFGTEGLEKTGGSLICCLLAFRPLKAEIAMNFLAGHGKALVLKKTKQLSNTLVNAPYRHRVSPLQLHRGQHRPFTPFCHQTEAPGLYMQTHLCRGQQPAAPIPHWAVKAPSQRQSSLLPQAIKGQSTSGEVPCQPPVPLAAHTLWGQAQCHSAHSAGKARDAEPRHTRHSSLTAPARTPSSSSPFPSSTADLCLMLLPSGWSGCVPPTPPPPITVRTVRLASLQNCRQTLPPYPASALPAPWGALTSCSETS